MSRCGLEAPSGWRSEDRLASRRLNSRSSSTPMVDATSVLRASAPPAAFEVRDAAAEEVAEPPAPLTAPCVQF